MTQLATSSTQRVTLRDYVARRPLAWFIVLACAISWVGWLLSEQIDLGVVNGFGILFSAGPALAAVIVSAWLRPERSEAPAGKRWALFGLIAILVLALTSVRRLWVTPAWRALAGNVASDAAFPSLLAVVVDVLGAALVAAIVSGVWSRRQGVRELLRSFDVRAHPVGWLGWALAVGLYPLVIVVGNVLSGGLSFPGPASQMPGAWYWLALDGLLTFLLFLFMGGGLEEPGWRGFALPRLQQRHSPLRSSLILSMVWALWHWPFYWAARDSLGGVAGVLLALALYWLLEVVPLSVLFTAAFNRTGGSLPILIVLHASINTTAVFLTPTALAQGLWILLCVGTALWMWQSSRPRKRGEPLVVQSHAH